MYFEERIIDGVLCHRNAPDGEWIAYTAAELTRRVSQYEMKRPVRVNTVETDESDSFFKKSDGSIQWQFRGHGGVEMNPTGIMDIQVPNNDFPGAPNDVVSIPIPHVNSAQAVIHSIVAHVEAARKNAARDAVVNAAKLLLDKSKTL